MRRFISISVAIVAALAIVIGFESAARSDEQEQLLKVRETVWRAWFANDRKNLEELVPKGSIAINSGEEKWQHQAEILQSAAEFQASGGKLIRLEFPRTEVQRFGDVAVTYSQYVYEREVQGQRSVRSGRVTEVFVLRHGEWTNPGWHTDTEK